MFTAIGCALRFEVLGEARSYTTNLMLDEPARWTCSSPVSRPGSAACRTPTPRGRGRADVARAPASARGAAAPDVTPRGSDRAVGGRAARGHGRARRLARASTATRVGEPIDAAFDADAHAGLLTFLDAPAAHATAIAPGQGPGRRAAHARRRARSTPGMPTAVAFRRARGGRARGRSRSRTLVRDAAARHPACCCSSTSPRSCCGGATTAPLDARRRSTCCRARSRPSPCVTGVHVCGDGDVRLALEAGPDACSASRSPTTSSHDADVARPPPRRRRLDRVGCGADRPARSANRADAAVAPARAVWCELTRRGCDPVRLRTRGDHHARVRARRPRASPGRARAAARRRDRRPRRRPGGRGPAHRRAP